MMLEVIGYWCLFMAISLTIGILLSAIKNVIRTEHHTTVALYFLVAVYCLR